MKIGFSDGLDLFHLSFNIVVPILVSLEVGVETVDAFVACEHVLICNPGPASVLLMEIRKQFSDRNLVQEVMLRLDSLLDVVAGQSFSELRLVCFSDGKFEPVSVRTSVDLSCLHLIKNYKHYLSRSLNSR